MTTTRENIAKIKELDALWRKANAEFMKGMPEGLSWDHRREHVKQIVLGLQTVKEALAKSAPGMAATVAQLAEDNARLVEVLETLVYLKNYKELHGKDDGFYDDTKAKAWADAQQALALHAKMMGATTTNGE